MSLAIFTKQVHPQEQFLEMTTLSVLFINLGLILLLRNFHKKKQIEKEVNPF